MLKIYVAVYVCVCAAHNCTLNSKSNDFIENSNVKLQFLFSDFFLRYLPVGLSFVKHNWDFVSKLAA